MKDKKDEFGLSTVKSSMELTSKDFLSKLQKEIVGEEQDALNDFIKGAYRLSIEKEREIEQLQKDVIAIREAIDKASKGNFEALGKIKIPARFFKEATLRQHGKSLVSGTDEIRFLDLYVVNEDKDNE